MRRSSRILGAVAALILVSGCGASEAKQEAEALGEALFRARSGSADEAALAFYSETFFSATPKSEWVELTGKVERKLGKPESHTLQGWYVFVGSQAAGVGTYVTLTYAVKYAKAQGQESLVIFKPSEGKAAIIGHRFNSAALLDDELGLGSDGSES